jgi:hypothetical protein
MDSNAEPSPENPFDRALRQHFATDPAPEDGGFSQRVMASLPARSAMHGHSGRRWAPWLRGAQWTALTLASTAAAWLLAPGGAPPDAAQQLAAASLIGLAVWWSLPGRGSLG